MMVCENGIYLQFKRTISLWKLLFIGQLIFWVFCYFFLFFFESTVRRGCRAGSIIYIVKYVNSEFESYCFL